MCRKEVIRLNIEKGSIRPYEIVFGMCFNRTAPNDRMTLIEKSTQNNTEDELKQAEPQVI